MSTRSRAQARLPGPNPLDDLSPLQRRYCEEWLLRVGTNASQAEIARAAGCTSTSPNGLRVRAKALHARTEAAREWLTERLIRDAANGALGFNQIKYLAVHGSPDSVRLQAASKLIELSGYQPIKISEVHHRHSVEHLSQQEIDARISALLAELPEHERQKLLPGSSGPTIDATFEEIQADPPSPAPSDEAPAEQEPRRPSPTPPSVEAEPLPPRDDPDPSPFSEADLEPEPWEMEAFDDAE